MSTFWYKVASVPTDAHTETNLVFVSPSDFLNTGALVLLHHFPFTIKADAAVVSGTIALNSVQRKCIGVTTTVGDRVEIPKGGFVPKTSVLIIQLKVEVEHFAASKKGGSVDVKAFVEFFQKAFHGQYYREGQHIPIILDNTRKYIAKVISLTSTDPSATADDVAKYDQKDSLVIVTTKEKCDIELTNIPESQMDTTQQNIVQKFELEKLGIGGLRAEFGQIFRRAFASRIFPMSLVKKLGIKHVKGVLLYGPPGTGKTLIARKIGEILNTKPPKIVNGPEVFNKYVGGTEENVRKLFAEAEEDQKSKGEQSPLHLIIFDEFDAICKQRGAVRDNTGVSDNVVNQLLSKIDGVSSLNNVLLIGMTNRKDLIDEAILRPGRFEVHVEIGLPDEDGRVEVFRIHTRSMRENQIIAADVDLRELAKETKNFSGAEIEGVVRSATSHAFNRHIDFENPTETINAADIMITLPDFQQALKEIVPSFGQAKDECNTMMRLGILDYGPLWQHVSRQMKSFLGHLVPGSKIHSLSLLLEGVVGCGKSAAAAHMALLSGFPYVKYISNDNMVSYGEMQKSNIIRKAFEDAYKSKLSVIVLDDIERLIEYSHLGGRYSNVLLQTLLVLIKRPPPEGRKLLVIGTTSLADVLDSLELQACFSLSLHLPTLDGSALSRISPAFGVSFKSAEELEKAVEVMPSNVCIKKLLLILEMASLKDATPQTDTATATAGSYMTLESFSSALLAAGLT